MKIVYRILLGLVVLSVYFIFSYLFMSISDRLPFKEILPKGVLFFAVVDCALAYLFLRRNLFISLISGLVVAYLSLSIAFMITANGYYPDFDAYGIETAIFSNALLSVLFWEILYRINEWLRLKKGL